jgi:hypothetical protein
MEMQLSEGGGVMIPSNALTSSHFCNCPQPVPGFPMPYVMGTITLLVRLDVSHVENTFMTASFHQDLRFMPIKLV